MSHVSIRQLLKNFDGKPPTVAVDHLDLEIEDGEFLVLLGPSGCGKTTTLRCLAGLEQPASGSITLGDEVVFDGARRVNLPPDKRFIGMVFQSYALWPHMTVRKNIAYPLKSRKLTDALADGRVEETAALVDCERLLDRLPAELSGGQQQRVALARGLVSHPDLVLFDEPLSNLDARLRDQVRAELHDLHQRKPFTAVFVTHDQSEALALGTRMAIMRAGRIVQIGPPREVFEEPVDEYVAGFTGMSNRVPCEYVDGRWYALGTEIHGMQPRAEASVGSFVLRLRPEKVRLVTDVADLLPGEAGMAVHIDDVEYGGLHFDVMCSVVGDGSVRRQLHARIQTFDTARMPRTVNRGATMIFAFDPLDARTFDTDGTALAMPRQALTGALVG
ncbi:MULTISPECIES: ABC transporter ATP-binding protein [Rhodococcus]|uniref:Trehalose import ATP-binding protein SugC n=1 Tax=Rhodococcus rhodochrous TaxID=1829 RepID=A0AA47AEY1_RHORH|nr:MULTISPECIES: ABC transporter ATP-binding protein [Rhodococcus]MBF4479268.1 ABC transporter ATP-binding protein [Rhodococcus rhodochrous]MCB8913117.1 ABC transporter ATP-binding protein [Rhodococcus rhodochrous]MCD2095886.1 ABC transporter ATP-binding protein [Rhodococcus rhodochrous]MCD2119680.1 ABC transporter ATP-binding protein [Rhodococcus rhodochrous]MCQ4135232.1 ABC transporter ATP-binding protein [Rhodococcus rhodochrous]